MVSAEIDGLFVRAASLSSATIGTTDPIITSGPSATSVPQSSIWVIPASSTSIRSSSRWSNIRNSVLLVEENRAFWTSVTYSTLATQNLQVRPTTLSRTLTGLPLAIVSDESEITTHLPATLIYIPFLHELNWEVVTTDYHAAAKIIDLLPMALSHGRGFPQSDVKVERLIPLDTQENLGYITTVALAYYPSGFIGDLLVDLRFPLSRLYNNPDAHVSNFTALINSDFDIVDFIDAARPLSLSSTTMIKTTHGFQSEIPNGLSVYSGYLLAQTSLQPDPITFASNTTPSAKGWPVDEKGYVQYIDTIHTT